MAALRKWGPWAVLLVVAAAALAIGLHRTSTPSLDAQVQSIASQARCPVCNGETVAQSQTAPSVEIRNQIRSDLLAGKTKSQILHELVQDYGPGVLEKPQTSGIALAVWVVPVIIIVAAAAALVLVLRRWKVRAGPAEGSPSTEAPAASAAVPAPAANSPAPAARVASAVPAPVRASVAVAGEAPAPDAAPAPPVDAPVVTEPAPPADAPVVTAPDGATALRRRLGAGGPGGEGSDRPARRRRTSWLVGGVGAALVAAGVSWAAVAAFHNRLPGQSVSGQALPAEKLTADLQAATDDAAKNDVVNAVKEYEKVLKVEPDQVQALTGLGWVLAQTGQPSLLQEGLTQLASAERIDPTYGPAHLYRGLALLAEANYSQSVPELQWYLDHNPDPQVTAQVKKALQQAQAGQAASPAGSKGSSPASGSSG